MMKGLSIDGMRKHPSLIPLFAFLGFGCGAAFYYTMRLATRNPDVSWSKRNNLEPWQAYENKQYKFYNAGTDNPESGVQAPKF